MKSLNVSSYSNIILHNARANPQRDSSLNILVNYIVDYYIKSVDNSELSFISVSDAYFVDMLNN